MKLARFRAEGLAVCLAKPAGLGTGTEMPVRAEGLVICIGLASRIELNHLRDQR